MAGGGAQGANPSASSDGGTLGLNALLATDTIEVFVTVGGLPVPGAQLTASRQRPQSAAWRPLWDAPLSERTDARGAAVFHAGAGAWVLSVVKEGFATTIVDVAKPAGEPVTVVRVSLETGHVLRGVAVDFKDVPVAPALVRATPLGDRSTRRRSSPVGVTEVSVNALGVFQFTALSAGWWRLEGEAEGAGRAEPMMISVPTSEVVKLHFRRSGFLEGVVVQADGGVAPRASVAITNEAGAESLEASETGTFSTERVPGSYLVTARLGEWVGAAEQHAQVRPGATTSVRVVLSGKGGRLHGTVKRDDGLPVEGAVLITSPHNDDGLSGQATTERDGTWSISNLPRGTYDLEVEAQGLVREEERGFFVPEGAPVEVNLVLGRLGKVSGRVETPTGAPLSLRVALVSRGRSFPERQALSDSAGHFEFDDVPPGPAVVRVVSEQVENTRPTDVVVKGGTNTEVKVVMPDSVALEINLDRSRCAPPSEIRLVAMETARSQQGRLVPVNTPRVTVTFSPGEWTLMGWAANDDCVLQGESKSVTLEAGKKPEPVTLVFGPLEGAVAVTVLEADGQPAAFASVSTRDETGRVSMVSTDADGVAQLSFQTDSSFSVTASKEGRSAQREGLRRSVGSVTLTLRPAARIHLRIDGASGITRLTVLVDGEAFVDEVRATGSEGWIEEMPAATLTVVASNADDTRAGRTRVVTREGQTAEASVLLEPLGQLRGRVQLPVGAANVFISLESPMGSDGAPVEPSGAFLFERLMPGDYLAKVKCKQCGSIAAKPVKVAPGGNAELVFP